jgi:tellurite methyltransferase
MTPEQVRWNEKYRSRGLSLFPPEDFLVKRRHVLRPGTVLDVACGDGRNAVYLARMGFVVTGVDFSTEGLRRLKYFASQEGLLVNTYQRDLNEDGTLSDLGQFDNIIVVHFKPSRHTFNEMSKVLRPNGVLLMTSFNTQQHFSRNFPRQYCYAEGEFVNVDESLELLEYVSYEDDRGYFDGYVFLKRN